MSLDSICSAVVKSRRGLSAFIWSLVTLAALLSFASAIIFALATNSVDMETDDGANNNNAENGALVPEIAVTSRAMAFAALWTAVLASLMSIFGTVILGFQSLTGQYYTCCSANVHRTTPLGLGAFIGALLMFANVTLVCSVLFSEFEIRDSTSDHQNQRREVQVTTRQAVMQRSSVAFSIMCMFLTILYFGFGALIFFYRNSIVKENELDMREEENGSFNRNTHQTSYTGYIDNRFDVRSSGKQSGYVVPIQQTGGSGSLI